MTWQSLLDRDISFSSEILLQMLYPFRASIAKDYSGQILSCLLLELCTERHKLDTVITVEHAAVELKEAPTSKSSE